MLGGTPYSAVLGAAPDRTADLDTLKAYIRAACKVGLQLLLIDPDGKTPLDMRSPQQRKKDNQAARDAAQAAGKKNWSKARSRAGVHLATSDAATVIKYLTAWRKAKGENAPVNFAVRVAHPLVIADADTAAQRDAFLAEMTGGAPVPYTVSSPGVQEEDGTWSHKDGGHWYFVNEGEPLPETAGPGTITAPGKWALIYRDRYVLIPPSARKEGAYRLTGREYPLPDELREMVTKAPKPKDRTAGPADENLAGSIASWAAAMSWAEILEPAGWVKAARVDGACDCEVFTAPGEHGSERSATAHGPECGLCQYDTEGNAPIHIWTDNPGDELDPAVAKWGKTLTKLQVWAAFHYGCDISKAITGENLSPLVDEKAIFEDVDSTQDFSAPMGDGPKTSAPDPEQDFSAPLGDPPPAGDKQQDTTADDASDPPGPPGSESTNQDPEDDGMLHIGDMTVAPFGYWRGLPPPEFMIEGLIEQGGLTCVIGEPGVGKSTVVIDWMCCIVTGKPWQGREVKRQRVLYLPGEGLFGAAARVRAWEQAHKLSVETELLMGNEILQIAKPVEDWAALAAYMTKMGVGLLVVDTFARANLGMEENSATEVGRSIERFKRVQTATSAGVMVIHHTTRGTEHGRGSTALGGALESEVLVKVGDLARMAGPGKAIDMKVTKQKNAHQEEDLILLSLVPFAGSAVVAGPDGILGDPFEERVAQPTLLPEPRIELAIRIARHVERLPSQGATRGELREALVMNPYVASRPLPEKAWKIAVNEGVDVGLRYGLLQTLSGTAAGSRYIRGTATFDQARAAAMDDGITD